MVIAVPVIRPTGSRQAFDEQQMVAIGRALMSNPTLLWPGLASARGWNLTGFPNANPPASIDSHREWANPFNNAIAIANFSTTNFGAPGLFRRHLTNCSEQKRRGRCARLP